MKKIISLAVLAAISGAASAQSSVTLFGVVDATARYVKNGDQHQYTLGSGGNATSRFGLRGVEDLGSGLSAGFWLESGLNVDNGTSSDSAKLFNRRSTVSLLGGFGEIRLGRDYTPTYLGYTDYDMFGDNGIAASSKFDVAMGVARDTTSNGAAPTAYSSGLGNRLGNQVMYLTPSNLGGFYGRGAVAAGEGVAGQKYYGGRVGYGAGPLDVSASYGQWTVAPRAGDDKYKTADVGAAYDFGVVKLAAYYTQSKWSVQKIATYSLGASVPVGAGLIKAQFTHANQSGTNLAGANIDGDDANQLAVGYVYNLSKRTAIYTTAAYLKNKGNARFLLNSSPAVSTASAAGGSVKSTGLDIGLRHSF